MTPMTKERAEAIAALESWQPWGVNADEIRELARLAAAHLGENAFHFLHKVLDQVGVEPIGGVAERIKLLASQRDTARNTLPQDVRDALQCAADYGPMDIYDWMRKWGIPDGVDWDDRLAAKCAAALAAHPDVAQPDLPKREIPATAFNWCDSVDNPALNQPFREDPEKIEAERVALRADVARLTAEVATWKGRAEWLLERMSKEAQ
jgi:hypothetical protein